MDQEEKVLRMLSDCWNEFVKLEKQHPDEQRDFCDGIHKCQYIIGMRFARENRGDLFPVKIPAETKKADNFNIHARELSEAELYKLYGDYPY